MSVVRMNITVSEELVEQVDKLIGPRKRSQFIADALRQRIETIRYERLQKALEEGYKVRKEESQSIASEYEHVDLEGWDEY
jgi:metal-responsive CopG/Arc/MetJ family transcriptional regulator